MAALIIAAAIALMLAITPALDHDRNQAMTISPARALSPAQITRNRYDEALRFTEAYRIQLSVRKRALFNAPEHKKPEACKRVEEAILQLEGAEREEYNAWLQMEHARQGR